MSTDPGTAYSQGIAEAKAALSQAISNQGWFDGGIIYYDIESYTSTPATVAAGQGIHKGMGGKVLTGVCVLLPAGVTNPKGVVHSRAAASALLGLVQSAVYGLLDRLQP